MGLFRKTPEEKAAKEQKKQDRLDARRANNERLLAKLAVIDENSAAQKATYDEARAAAKAKFRADIEANNKQFREKLAAIDAAKTE